jgi:hypothetical protein
MNKNVKFNIYQYLEDLCRTNAVEGAAWQDSYDLFYLHEFMFGYANDQGDLQWVEHSMENPNAGRIGHAVAARTRRGELASIAVVEAETGPLQREHGLEFQSIYTHVGEGARPVQATNEQWVMLQKAVSQFQPYNDGVSLTLGSYDKLSPNTSSPQTQRASWHWPLRFVSSTPNFAVRDIDVSRYA